MAASGESSRKSRDHKGQTDTKDIDDLIRTSLRDSTVRWWNWISNVSECRRRHR